MTIEPKDLIFSTIDDLVLDLVKFDRKDDEELPFGVIDGMVKNRQLTIEQMVTRFREALEVNLAHAIPPSRRR